MQLSVILALFTLIFSTLTLTAPLSVDLGEADDVPLSLNLDARQISATASTGPYFSSQELSIFVSLQNNAKLQFPIPRIALVKLLAETYGIVVYLYYTDSLTANGRSTKCRKLSSELLEQLWDEPSLSVWRWWGNAF
jgi:hypothetical protein